MSSRAHCAFAFFVACLLFHVADQAVSARQQRGEVAGRPVVMSPDQKRKLDTFFSNFVEAGVRPFEPGALTDEDLIAFGFRHNQINAWNKHKSHNDSNDWFSASDVSTSAIKYFNIGIKKHHAISGLLFDGQDYGVPGAAGDGVLFAQVARLSDLGNGMYRADIKIYERTTGEDPQDTHIDPARMAKQGTPVSMRSEMSGWIRSVGDGSQAHYILVAYRPVKGIHAEPTKKIVRRCILPLKDAHGTLYTFCLISSDEKTHVMTADDHFTPAPWGTPEPGMSYAYGHYEMALIPPGQIKPILQNIALTEKGQERNLLPFTFQTYTVKGGPGVPDLLVWAMNESGRSVQASVYIIDHGKLASIAFQQSGKPLSSGWEFCRGNQLQRVGPQQYWAYFIFSASNYEHWIWQFDPSKHLMNLTADIETRNAELPKQAHVSGIPPQQKIPVTPRTLSGQAHKVSVVNMVATDCWNVKQLAAFLNSLSPSTTWGQVKRLLPANAHYSRSRWVDSEASTGNQIIVSGPLYAELYFGSSDNPARQPFSDKSPINQIWIRVGNGTLNSRTKSKEFVDALAHFLGPPKEAKWRTDSEIDPPLSEGWQASWRRAKVLEIEYSNLLWLSKPKPMPTVSIWIVPPTP